MIAERCWDSYNSGWTCFYCVTHRHEDGVLFKIPSHPGMQLERSQRPPRPSPPREVAGSKVTDSSSERGVRMHHLTQLVAPLVPWSLSLHTWRAESSFKYFRHLANNRRKSNLFSMDTVWCVLQEMAPTCLLSLTPLMPLCQIRLCAWWILFRMGTDFCLIHYNIVTSTRTC